MPDSKVITWFDIPASDIHRAVGFYNSVLGVSLEVVEKGGHTIALFSENPNVTGGSITLSETNIPANGGTVIYFFVDDLDGVLSRVEPAGGKIVQPKAEIMDEHGYFGIINDTEGNRIGLHGDF